MAAQTVDSYICGQFPEFRRYSIADRERVYQWAQQQAGEQLGAAGTAAAVIGIITALITAGVAIAQIVQSAKARKRIDKDWAKAQQIEQQTRKIQSETAAILSAAAEQEQEQKKNTYTALAIAGIAAVGAFFL